MSAVKEKYIDEKELNMYRIQLAPPKWDLQEYIVTYLKEQDDRTNDARPAAWFLFWLP